MMGIGMGLFKKDIIVLEDRVIEQYKFLGISVRKHQTDEKFYPEGYLLLYPDVEKSGMNPWGHYVRFGRKEGRSNGLIPPSGRFSPEGYLLLYPDVEKSGMDPWKHYVKHGRKEGRSNGVVPPSDRFDSKGYLLLYPDVEKSGMNPWRHYVRFGRKEGRSNGLFYPEGYLLLYPDVEKSGMDPWEHYLKFGKEEGRSNGVVPPSDRFDSKGYLLLYPGVEKSGMNPWRHYVRFGRKEGRSNGLFYPEGYLFLYPDVEKSGMDPWEHYARFGLKKRRKNGTEVRDILNFDGNEYTFIHPELLDRRINPLRHYILYGKDKGWSSVINIRKSSAINDNKGKKILLISHELSTTGAPLSLRGIAEVLIKAGFYIDIWTFDKIEDDSVFNGIDCDINVVPRNPKYFKNLKKCLSWYDLIICNTVVSGNYASFCLENNIPHIWWLRENDSLLTYLRTLNISHKLIKDDADNIICVSDYVRQHIRDEFFSEVRVINNFIEDRGNSEWVLEDRLRFTFVGSLNRRKGLDVLVRAFLSMNPLKKDAWQLNIVGNFKESEKDYWGKLYKLTENYNNIKWHGRLVGEEKWRLFTETDVFIVPSLDEPSSRVVLEAAMLGRPSIVTENVGAKYICSNGAGLIVRPGDLVSLRKCLEQVIGMERESLLEMGRKSRLNYESTSTPEIFEESFKEQLFRYISDGNTVTIEKPPLLERNVLDNGSFVDLGKVTYLLEEQDVVFNIPKNELIDIIIPVYNGLEHLKVLLPSLFKNTTCKHRFIFVNDCSGGETREWLSAQISDRDDCILIENEINVGFVLSVNRGASHVEGNNFIILNTDTEVPPYWIERLTAPLFQHDDIATVTPLSSCATIFSFPKMTSDSENKEFLNNFGLEKIDSVFSKISNDTLIDVPTGHGFCMAVSYKAWVQIGKFNELLFDKGYGEEVDWCQRALTYNWRHVVARNCYIAHYHGGSFPDEIRQQRLKSSSDILRTLYPDFHNSVSKWQQVYPLRDVIATAFMKLVSSAEKIQVFNNKISKNNIDFYTSRNESPFIIIEKLKNGECRFFVRYHDIRIYFESNDVSYLKLLKLND
ncbi:MAG: glycosyltransferase [Oxalobacter sp.]|nr:glycosyltransferase [Oxalobacter sp.]